MSECARFREDVVHKARQSGGRIVVMDGDAEMLRWWHGDLLLANSHVTWVVVRCVGVSASYRLVVQSIATASKRRVS